MAPAKVPQLDLVLLEHEAAHLLHPSSGAPDAAEWEAAITADIDPADQSGLRLVEGIIEYSYPPAEHLLEDWAYSVLHAELRGGRRSRQAR